VSNESHGSVPLANFNLKCIQQQNWETEHLLLLNWVTALEKMMVTFDDSVTESMAKELGQVLQSFSR
jgi:hypothetical protein